MRGQENPDFISFLLAAGWISSATIHGFPTSMGICPPAVMRNMLCGLQTVDTANAIEVLLCGTDTDSHNPSTRFLCDKWNDAERQWHIRTVQITHHLGGLGLTPQCASSIAAFYHSTARFVGWMAQMDAPERWLGSAQKLDQSVV
jgi:predicted metal-binding protein